MSTTAIAKQNNGTELAASKREAPITDQVLAQINKMLDGGRLTLPNDYSVGNALASAWLMLQDVQATGQKNIIVNGQPTGVVTTRSIANALTDMVTQGLNPAKKQCYFIVYGDKLTHQRSYFGDMALAERLMPGITFDYDVVRDGDDVTVAKERTKSSFVEMVQKHVKKLFGNGDILGAYCGVFDKDGEPLGYTVFPMARIQKSWTKSKTVNFDNATHKIYTDEMCLRTVIRHRCKSIINSSSDELLMEAIRRSESESVESEVAEESAQFANQDVIDVSHGGFQRENSVPQTETRGDEQSPFQEQDEF
jgi:recombination protein RecT